jgi:hypothetical protein
MEAGREECEWGVSLACGVDVWISKSPSSSLSRNIRSKVTDLGPIKLKLPKPWVIPLAAEQP